MVNLTPLSLSLSVFLHNMLKKDWFPASLTPLHRRVIPVTTQSLLEKESSMDIEPGVPRILGLQEKDVEENTT